MIDDYLMLLILIDSVRVFEKYPDNTRMKAEQIQLLIKRANEWLHSPIRESCGCWDSQDGKSHLICNKHAD